MDRIKIKLFLVFTLLSLFGQYAVEGQTLMFEHRVDEHPDDINFGPNRTHFLHPFVSTSLFFSSPGSTSIMTRQPFTGSLSFGLRYKLKLTKRLSLVGDGSLNRNSFALEQSGQKFFPDTLPHQRQTIRTLGLTGGVFARFRLGQNGDYLGNYLDIGITSKALMKVRLTTVDTSQSTNYQAYKIEKTTNSVLDNLVPVTYALSVRLGLDRIYFDVSYRLSKLANTRNGLDLPRIETGIGVSLVSY